MKKTFLLFFILCNVHILFYGLSSGESYSSIQVWNIGEDVLGGEVKVKLDVIEITDDYTVISITKCMTPFSQVILEKTKAIYNGSEYIFNFIDGWGNHAFGHFMVKNNEEILFYLDCNEYSDAGRNLGRLYGDTYLLKKMRS
jgi:hypothetical protein